jgi:hypothetical protein
VETVQGSSIRMPGSSNAVLMLMPLRRRPLGLALTVECFSVMWNDLPVHALIVLPHYAHAKVGFRFQLDLLKMGETRKGYGAITDDL